MARNVVDVDIEEGRREDGPLRDASFPEIWGGDTVVERDEGAAVGEEGVNGEKKAAANTGFVQFPDEAVVPY